MSFGPFAVGLSKGYTSPALASMQQSPSLPVDNATAAADLRMATIQMKYALLRVRHAPLNWNMHIVTRKKRISTRIRTSYLRDRI